jgi:phenylalanyl-tRNA synthetase beta chain
MNRDHDLIVELQDLEVGSALPQLVPDWLIEIDNKSLTNRPDLWGHFGMAREVAAIFGHRLEDPADLSIVPGGPAAVEVIVEDPALCPRFSALLVENVTVRPSPPWFQFRLQSLGLNPINNLVDITNYVMALLPQPMHAFDADKLSRPMLVARAARAGERLAALNGETYDLDPSMIAVAGADGPLAIAGVMGGASSMISAATTRVILEAATWNAASVRRTSTKLKLRTDASMRFEKSLDPANTLRGLAVAVDLLKQLCPEARVTGGVADVRGEAAARPPIELPVAWLERKLGRAIAQSEVTEILRSLQFGVEERPGVLTVTVPSWRATKDISIEADLVEEVGRMVGYASIAPVPPMVPVAPPPLNQTRAFQNRYRKLFCALGFTEVQNYSFVSDAEARRFGFPQEQHLRVLNPIASDQALLRVSLIPKIHRNIEENRKHLESFRFFEIGHEIQKQAEGLPSEVAHLAAVIYSKGDGRAEFEELKRVAAVLPGVEFLATEDVRCFEHPARAAQVHWQGEVVGRLFEFHPAFVEVGRAAVLDLDLARVERLEGLRQIRYSPMHRYPSSSFDLSVTVAARTHSGAVMAEIVQHSGPGVSAPLLLEDYAHADGRRSLLFRLTFALEDRTPTAEEAGAVRQKLIDGLRAAGYELRA